MRITVKPEVRNKAMTSVLNKPHFFWRLWSQMSRSFTLVQAIIHVGAGLIQSMVCIRSMATELIHQRILFLPFFARVSNRFQHCVLLFLLWWVLRQLPLVKQSLSLTWVVDYSTSSFEFVLVLIHSYSVTFWFIEAHIKFSLFGLQDWHWFLFPLHSSPRAVGIHNIHVHKCINKYRCIYEGIHIYIYWPKLELIHVNLGFKSQVK